MTDDIQHNTPAITPSSAAALLSAGEVRVLGALMEKQLFTPETYPLTMNALLNACNQKSNRIPVSHYQISDVARILAGLQSRDLVRKERFGRAERYAQQLSLQQQWDEKSNAIFQAMFVRGPHTRGELLTRTERAQIFRNADSLQQQLDMLVAQQPALVYIAPRQSGQREIRYGQLLSEPIPEQNTAANDATTTSLHGSTAKMEHMQQQIDALQTEVAIIWQHIRGENQ